MVTLDQVLLLQEKVETAVKKITSLNEKVMQLESENDALRSKCAELTKAISEKSELVSTLEDTQAKIEQSILETLNRLDAVQDSILSRDDSNVNSVFNSHLVSHEVADVESEQVQPSVAESKSIQENEIEPESQTQIVPEEESFEFEQKDEVVSENNSSLSGQFDIF
ncbi:MAG: hypothetical protein PUJ70_09165 [Treponema sp.]|nr:hypothetical protein [Treponema sp.]MDY5838207.1 hypothetical protein [Treponema sp.]